MNSCDLLGREIDIDDYVVFHNCLYIVHGISQANPRTNAGPIRIMLYNASKTTRPVNKHSSDVVLVPKEAVMEWEAKQGNKNGTE